MRKSLKQALADVRREVEESPEWLREIYARNRAIDERGAPMTRAVALCLGILVGSCTVGCGSAIQTQARAATVAAVATAGAARVVDGSAVEDARTTCPRESTADMAACLAPVRARWAPADAAIASTKAALVAWVEALEIARIAGDGADLWEPLAIAAARLVREYDALVAALAAVGVELPPLPAFVIEASDLVGGE